MSDYKKCWEELKKYILEMKIENMRSGVADEKELLTKDKIDASLKNIEHRMQRLEQKYK